MPEINGLELAYTKALGYRWLRRDDRVDGMILRGDSRLVEVRKAQQNWRCSDCGREIKKKQKYGWRATQRFYVTDGGLYERVGWSEHYCARCIRQTPISSRHRGLPKNRRKGSDYRSPVALAREDARRARAGR